jgi:protein-S-isoprenylcysteine O-methyltransferase Ste14
MIFHPDGTAELVYFVVLACYLGLAVIAILGKRGAAKGAKKRDLKSNAGFLLQGIGYAICFAFARTRFSPILPMPNVSEAVLAALTVAIAVASVWFCHAAAQTLGKQWALVARVIDGHQLIAHGPYAIVRNPIYLAMLGILVATGLAVSRWQALLAATAVFFAGTVIRIRTEERLLAEVFGAEFYDYARRVPALFPRLVR